jgi:SAM-dependent methyltransferase
MGQSKLNRNNKLLSRIAPHKQVGLEIGPLDKPIVPKKGKLTLINYVDYTTPENLKKIYKDAVSVDINNIVDVDYVWGDISLYKLVGEKQFDYIIASHVIEHVPDMIGWLKELADVIKNDGVLSLAIPDKRYTFDFFRELSTPGMFIEAFIRNLRRPSPQAIFDYVALTTEVDPIMAWEQKIFKKEFVPQQIRLEQAYHLAQDSIRDEIYHDAHVGVFHPVSFLNIIKLFMELGLFDYFISDFYNTERNEIEFFISLKRLHRNLGIVERLPIQLNSVDNILSSLL